MASYEIRIINGITGKILYKFKMCNVTQEEVEQKAYRAREYFTYKYGVYCDSIIREINNVGGGEKIMKTVNIISYENGYEFFHDLISTYGKTEGITIAKKYLDLQIKNKDPEEHEFCCELYHAMKNCK